MKNNKTTFSSFSLEFFLTQWNYKDKANQNRIVFNFMPLKIVTDLLAPDVSLDTPGLNPH